MCTGLGVGCGEGNKVELSLNLGWLKAQVRGRSQTFLRIGYSGEEVSLRLELWEKSCPPRVCRVRQTGRRCSDVKHRNMHKCDVKDLRGACWAPFKQIRNAV